MNPEELKTLAEAAKQGALIAMKPLLTIEEAAMFLGCSESYIRKRVAAGTIRAAHMDKKRMIERSDLLRLAQFGPAPR